MSNELEVWLRGPLKDMPLLLQPVAQALLQAREELNKLMSDFPGELLWEKPAAVAAPGFHLQHLTGVLNRLFTYANGKQLDMEQLAALEAEGTSNGVLVTELVEKFNKQVDKALLQLSETNPDSLTAARSVGRSKLPSTVFGLYVHAAEHTMRHLGQLLVTVSVLKHK